METQLKVEIILRRTSETLEIFRKGTKIPHFVCSVRCAVKSDEKSQKFHDRETFKYWWFFVKLGNSQNLATESLNYWKFWSLPPLASDYTTRVIVSFTLKSNKMTDKDDHTYEYKTVTPPPKEVMDKHVGHWESVPGTNWIGCIQIKVDAKTNFYAPSKTPRWDDRTPRTWRSSGPRRCYGTS